MRSIVYILCCAVVLLSSCGEKGAYTYIHKSSIDSVFCSSSLPLYSTTGIYLKLSKISQGTSSFYITPANYNFYTYETLVNSIVADTATNEANAIKLWRFMKDYTVHSKPLLQERLPHDPLRLVNSFQSGLCDDRNAALAKLFSLAGYNARVWHLEGHVVAEVYYDNAWHMFDADWGMYCMNGTAVADVAYISAHPEVITLGDSYSSLVRNYIGPAILKHVYVSTKNNYVNAWYDEVELDYKNGLQLRKGDELHMHVEQLNWEGKLRSLIGKHTIASTRHWGKLSRMINTDLTDTYVHYEESPYAIEKVSISVDRQAQPVRIYYSADGNEWKLKGMLGDGNTNVSFKPTDVNGEDKVFLYKLKFEPVNQGPVKQVYTVSNAILFSEKILLNKDTGFCIVPIAGADVQIAVKAWQKEGYK